MFSVIVIMQIPLGKILFLFCPKIPWFFDVQDIRINATGFSSVVMGHKVWVLYPTGAASKNNMFCTVVTQQEEHIH